MGTLFFKATLMCTVASGFVTLGSICHAENKVAKVSPLAPKLNEETIAPDEAQKFEKFVNIVLNMQKQDATQHDNGTKIRTFHGKSHGCLRGEIFPLDSRPEETKFGIFSEGVRSLPVVARFSNGLGTIKPDAKGDVRGLALKVFGVSGEKYLEDRDYPDSQDFLMTNNPTPLADNVDEFVDFGLAIHNKLRMPFFLLTHPRVSKLVFTRLRREIPTILNEQFWSGSPYRLGPRAIKYNITPCVSVVAKMPKDPSDNYLREDLVNRMRSAGACFYFNVQFQRDPILQPIEKHLTEWREQDTPSIPVAKIWFPPQSFDEPDKNKLCEDLSFNPWHSLVDHKPLGNMNRARRLIYQRSKEARSN